MRTKKKLFAAALAVCMLGILSFSTLAWFNASESVTNKFMVASTGSGTGTGGGSTDEKIFSVDLWEYVGDADNLAGDTDVQPTEKDHDGIEFDNILPGVVYHKEPVVENTGSYDQYVRMVVTVGKADEWTALLTKYGITDLGTIFLGHDETVWECYTAGSFTDATENTISFVYYLNDKLTPGETAVLFEQVQLPGTLTQQDMATMADAAGAVQFDITVRADAIQTEGLGAGIDTAQKAFESIGWTADTTYEQAMNP